MGKATDVYLVRGFTVPTTRANNVTQQKTEGTKPAQSSSEIPADIFVALLCPKYLQIMKYIFF